MHEFDTTEQLFQLALTKAELQEGERIRRLQIALDPDSGYAPDAIRFYFEQLAQGTAAEGAELNFELTPMSRTITLQQIEIDEVITDRGGTGEKRETEPVTRWRLQIGGVIQGVGFRPFLHNLARQLGLNGWVCNSSTGVEMELQGPVSELGHFLHHLRHDAPPLARVLTVEMTSIPPILDQPLGLEIRASQNGTGRTLVSPDVAPCPRCLSEMFTPTDRRYDYPFTNCTHCGPRFTIILDLPYDRPLTTMANFPLCPACAGEYRDPDNHRFHAQPIACPECGPKIWYADNEAVLTLTPDSVISAAALAAAIRCLNQGGTVALKGLGGFHLVCRADQTEAVRKLRATKNRPDKPLAVMVRSLAEATEFCYVSPAEQALLVSPEAPIVLLRKRTDCYNPPPDPW